MNQFSPLSEISLMPSDIHAPEPVQNENSDPAPAREPRKARRRKNGSSGPVAAKNYILDTNVLLHDPGCVQRFADNHVWIPVDVLTELDRFKNEQSERGANARAVHRL